MANTRSGNTFYVDAASSGAGSYIDEKAIVLLGVIFTSDAADDAVTINDLSSGPGAGNLKLKVKAGIADQSIHIDLGESPILFPNGIWISAISSNSVATLILRSK